MNFTSNNTWELCEANRLLYRSRRGCCETVPKVTVWFRETSYKKVSALESKSKYLIIVR